MVNICKFLLKITKITSANKTLLYGFKKWNQLIISENYKDVCSSVEKANDELDVLSIKLVVNIFRTKFLSLFKQFCNNSTKKFVLSLQSNHDQIPIFSPCMERMYNKRLLKCLNGIDRLGTILVKGKSKIFRVNQYSFEGNMIYPYFEEWRTSNSKISRLKMVELNEAEKKRIIYLVPITI
jgi:hypothetical protein